MNKSSRRILVASALIVAFALVTAFAYLVGNPSEKKEPQVEKIAEMGETCPSNDYVEAFFEERRDEFRKWNAIYKEPIALTAKRMGDSAYDVYKGYEAEPVSLEAVQNLMYNGCDSPKRVQVMLVRYASWHHQRMNFLKKFESYYPNVEIAQSE